MLFFKPRTVISCDIQPRYSGGVTFDLRTFVKYLDKFDKILYLFNNKDINVPDTVESVKDMLAKEGGASEDLLNRIHFREKVYYYFRDVLDDPRTNYNECIKLLKMLILRGCENAYELPVHDLKMCLSDSRLIQDILTKKLHFYYDPKLAADLWHYNYCEEVGGFENQCNIEITLYLDALGMQYQKNYDYIF